MLSWIKELIFSDASADDSLGTRGENVAARFLRNLGYRIIVRNFRNDVGEVDIIARDGATLVFVEVKTRTDDDVTPEAQVGPEKQHQISRLARMYLKRYGVPQPQTRFDVVAVIWPAGRPPMVRHHIDAFPPT